MTVAKRAAKPWCPPRWMLFKRAEFFCSACGGLELVSFLHNGAGAIDIVCKPAEHVIATFTQAR